MTFLRKAFEIAATSLLMGVGFALGMTLVQWIRGIV
jgi:hypothetical protein